MKARRSLNLLVAAAGLVFLSGCATETLTDSAFWSYLPFGSSKGGNGSGGHGAGTAPRTSPEAKPADQPKPATPPTRSTDPISEGWNDPVAPKKDAGVSTPPPQAKGADAGHAPSLPAPDQATTAPKRNPDGTPGLSGTPAPALKVSDTAPTLPALAGRPADASRPTSLGLPTPDRNQQGANTKDAAHLGDTASPSPVNGPAAPRPRLPETAAPMGKGQRTPLRLPELIVDGSGPATVGKPTLAELPKRAPLPTPEGSLNLPREIVGPAAVANPDRDRRRLPQAITETPQRATPAAGSLPLPGFPEEGPRRGPGQASSAGPVVSQPQATATQRGGPGIIIPGAPVTPAPDGRTLTSGVAGGPLPAKAAGVANALPAVGPSGTLPAPPIPAPFRLSEWISNDALHQAWRRRQSERAQLEPRLRDEEQQRLRLILDTYLLREKPEGKSGQ